MVNTGWEAESRAGNTRGYTALQQGGEERRELWEADGGEKINEGLYNLKRSLVNFPNPSDLLCITEASFLAKPTRNSRIRNQSDFFWVISQTLVVE